MLRLDQEQDYLQEERHSVGLAHMMHRGETDRMQSIVNVSLPRLLCGFVSLVADKCLLQVDRQLALMCQILHSLLKLLDSSADTFEVLFVWCAEKYLFNQQPYALECQEETKRFLMR